MLIIYVWYCLRLFVDISMMNSKLYFCSSKIEKNGAINGMITDWNCFALSLKQFSRLLNSVILRGFFFMKS